MTWFLSLLEKLGLCKAYVDPFGRLLGLRYYVFGLEPDENDVDLGKAKPRWLPNLYIHKFCVDFGPDGGNYHVHPWSSASLILKGGYKEHVLDEEPEWKYRGSFIPRGKSFTHFISDTIPGTVSLFFHGFRAQAWGIQLASCNDICDWCVTNNEGACNKTGIDLAYHEYHSQIGEKKAAQWVIWNAKARKKLDRRKAAVKRAGITPPNKQELEAFVQTQSKLAFEIMGDPSSTP